MRIGIVADVHGNEVALRAVLEDASGLGIDRWWALGDLVLFGPRPVEVCKLLLGLPGIAFVRGNTDRYVVTDEQPAPHSTPLDASGDAGLVERFGLMAAGIDTDTSDVDLQRLLEGCDADLVVGGHTHDATDREVGCIRALNGGSVGMPRRQAGAGWLIIEADHRGVSAQRRTTHFDVHAVCDDLRQRRHPNGEFVEPILMRQHPFAH